MMPLEWTAFEHREQLMCDAAHHRLVREVRGGGQLRAVSRFHVVSHVASFIDTFARVQTPRLSLRLRKWSLAALLSARIR